MYLIEGQFNVWWPNFGRQEVWHAHKGHSGRHRSAIIPENIQNLRECFEESPRKSTRHLSQETGISRTSVVRILHFEGKSLRSLWRILTTDVLEMPVSCESVFDFLGDSSRHSSKFWICSGMMAERCRPLWPLWVSVVLPVSEVWPPNVELSFYQVHVPSKISPALSLRQKKWFCGKVHRHDFHPVLNRIASSWIHISVKRISQGCCLYHLKNMGKKIVKHNFGMKNKTGCFFGPLCN